MNQLANFVTWYAHKLFDHPYVKTPPLVLSGVGRSGTTALRMSLGRHSNIVYNGAENNIVMDILQTALHNCSYPSRKASMQMSPSRYNKAFRNLILGMLYPRPVLRITKTGRWMVSTDITPPLAEYLKELFPEMRLIYLVRNGIEVVSSRMVFDGFRERPFSWQCEIWARAEPMIRWGLEQDYFYLIRHESLLDRESVSQVFGDLWRWLGLKDDSRCLETLTGSIYHPTSFANEDSSKACDLRNRTSRWEFWDDEQRDIFVKHCSSAMAFLNYKIPWLPNRQGAMDD